VSRGGKSPMIYAMTPFTPELARVMTPRAGDLAPILFWKHFRQDSAGQLAATTASFYREHDLVAVKLMPDIPILFEDFSLNSFRPLRHLRSFGDAVQVGRAGEYLRCVELLRRQLEPSDVLLATLFSPLGLVGLWSGQEGVRELLREPRASAHEVLAALGGLVAQLGRYCLSAGADGIYYSCWGQDVLSEQEYSEFGVPYDLMGLRGAQGASVRMLHIHGGLHHHVERYAAYPVDAIGWSEQESSVTLVQGGSALPGRIMMGGLSEVTAAMAGAAERSHVLELQGRLGDRLLVAPGCSLPDEISPAALASLRQLVRVAAT